MKPRARDLGIRIGTFEPGALNAITDVEGIRVGHTTLIHGPAADRVEGVVRTGVTVIIPREEVWENPVFGGFSALNGNGEMTGTIWLEEAGLLSTPIGLTNTHSVGIVRDTIVHWIKRRSRSDQSWLLPVTAETWDGWLNDINGMHVRREHVLEALDGARGGAVAEGNVGGGTGMVCHEFKGGIGTSSRVVHPGGQPFTLGVLVQSNYGRRCQLTVRGVPVGRAIPVEEVPGRYPDGAGTLRRDGSIIIVIATDAPLLPGQCKRLARRAALGLGRMGSVSENGSGDIFLAFSTGNEGRGLLQGGVHTVSATGCADLNLLFEAAVEATEEAILNSLLAAETLSGIEGHTAHALPAQRLLDALAEGAPTR